ncbi:MAG: AMP-binding protein [Candidatus Freyarchaeota archaeon]|nr:AMP-binding protein [Candidatus Jordarchaeia archaeon]
MDENSYFEALREKWERKWPRSLPKEPIYPYGQIPIFEYLRRRSRSHPERTAIIYYGSKLSYGLLDELSERFAFFLTKQGLGKGDVVAVQLPNCPQLLISYFGVLKAGCVCALINPWVGRSGTEYMLGEVKPKIVVCADSIYPIVSQSSQKIDGVEHIVTTSLSDFAAEPDEKAPPEVKSKPKQAGGLSLISLLEESKGSVNVEVSLDDDALIIFTGGSYGVPRACLHTHWNILFKTAVACTYSPSGLIVALYGNRQLDAETLMKHTERGVYLGVMPAFWVAGKLACVDAPIFAGGTVVLMVKWDPEYALYAIDKYKVTSTFLEFSLYEDLLRHPKLGRYNLRSLRSCIGSSIRTYLTARLRGEWFNITKTVLCESSYGLTETHTIDTVAGGFHREDFDLKQAEKHGGVFCGIPVPGTLIKIVDPKTGELLPLGEVGEIVIKSPSLAKGYLKRPDETRKKFVKGWLRTGDLGKYDEDGFLYFMGRIRDVEEFEFHPIEVERRMLGHPAVGAAKALTLTHPERGSILTLVIEPKREYREKLSEKEIEDWCSRNLPSPLLPCLVLIKDELPTTGSGKTDVEKLRREAEELLREKLSKPAST